jgi:tetratricopeptide (TPR) repeat protein
LDIITYLSGPGAEGEDYTEETKKEDLEQQSSIYFNMYLAAITKGDKQSASHYNLNATEVNKKFYGERSLNVSNNYFIEAQLRLKLGNPREAKDWLLKALDIVENDRLG